MIEEFERLAARVRNWGRWGEEDQRGTLNFIKPEALRRGVAEVVSGKLFNLGIRFDAQGPQTGRGGRFNPKLYASEIGKQVRPGSRSRYSDDVVHMPLQSATQWDALAHCHYDGLLYNGCKACDVLGADGAARNGVENLAEPGIMSRAVLLDVARYRQVDELEPGYSITVDELNAVCEKQNVTVERGDIVLIRTGHIRHFTIRRDRERFTNGLQPGVAAACAEWLHDKEVAAIAADNLAVEVFSEETFNSEMPLPFHQLALRDMGCPLGEIFNLEGVAAECEVDGRYAFLLSAPALAVTGAFGSPVNPLALK